MMCPAVYDSQGVHLQCVLSPDHIGPHWHRPTPKVDIRLDAGIHWFAMAEIPMEPVP